MPTSKSKPPRAAAKRGIGVAQFIKRGTTRQINHHHNHHLWICKYYKSYHDNNMNLRYSITNELLQSRQQDLWSREVTHKEDSLDVLTALREDSFFFLSRLLCLSFLLCHVSLLYRSSSSHMPTTYNNNSFQLGTEEKRYVENKALCSSLNASFPSSACRTVWAFVGIFYYQSDLSDLMALE